MTSSLVGSEMCIRDRSLAVRSVPERRARSDGSMTSGRRIPLWMSVMSSAVSYTHLTLPTICSV
eukprot:2530927-Prorocentrum_lima.AAC.1